MKILIIDDDPAVRYTLGRVLVHAGHSVSIAPDGEQGLDIYESDCPEVIVTDLIMPRKGGLETIERIRRLNPKVKIIAISGGMRISQRDGLAKALAAGADTILAKPFTPAELLATVTQLTSTD
jgi:CheY-like chemotaxis protein